jgi:hypothetical protein
MNEIIPEHTRTKVVRLGDYIAIQWLTQKGTPMQTITLSVDEALRVAQEVQRRAQNG